MGSVHLVLLPPSTLYYLGVNPTRTFIYPSFSSDFRCSFSSRRDPNSDPFRGDRFEFEGGVRESRRNWWSDDEDDDEDDDSGFWEEPSVIDWVFKILGSFGWMIPAVALSTLLGTGTNSLIMALVLPLGQTALSLVMEKLWGASTSSQEPRPRSRSRSQPRNPFSGSTTGSQKNKRGGTRDRGAPPMNGGYQSWGAANSGSAAKKSGKNGSKYGGWDELDEFGNSVPKEGQNQRDEGLEREKTGSGKLSMRKRGERPLFIRLLIAVFPFLGSWTRFLF